VERSESASSESSGAPLERRVGLRRVATDALTIRRVRRGRGFSYVARDGSTIRDPRVLRRLRALAVPPAYDDVCYAADPSAHLQAVGRDAAGRLQYRYHPDWEKLREERKARHLMRLVETLPRIRRAVTQHLAAAEPVRDFALAAVVELVASTAIRSGSEEYARAHGTRGAATLLKSNVEVTGDKVVLSFRAKGGKKVDKEVNAPRLAAAIAKLRGIPGRRLFQYRDESGEVRAVRARDVNEFLRAIAGARVSLKDFRTLCASALVLDRLARATPAKSERARRRQVLEAIRLAADDLANTPAICRKSYVHETVLTAFETGVLERFGSSLNGSRSRRERLVAKVLAATTSSRAAAQRRPARSLPHIKGPARGVRTSGNAAGSSATASRPPFR
jgi:DNA topoisomerase-1